MLQKTALILVLLTLAFSALAHNGATGIVGQRMQDMTQMGQALRTVQQGVRAGEHNQENTSALETIITNAKMMPARFETQEFGQGSDASPLIWSDWDDFVARAKSLEEMSQNLLISLEAQDFEAATPLLRDVQASCGSCHATYREKATR